MDDLRVIPRLIRDLGECCQTSTLQIGREDERANLIKRMRDVAKRDALFVLGVEQLLFDEFGRMCVAPSLAYLNAQRDVLPKWLTGRILLCVPDRAYWAYREGLRDLDDFVVSADLRRPILENAELRSTDSGNARMEVTRLEDADLTDTKITPEQLATYDGRSCRRS